MSNDRPMSRRFAIALVLSFVCLAVPAWADFQAGMDANNRGDYATALREWRPLAEQGDVLAQYNLGILYFNGGGVPKDYQQALRWFRLAADQGEALAQTKIAIMYDDGQVCRMILSRLISGTTWRQRTEISQRPNFVMLSPNR